MTPKFLVAKYVPNLRRMEPKNIGVVAWAPGAVSGRFLGEKRNGTTTVKAPSFVAGENKRIYSMWIASWRELLSRGEVDLDGGRRTATLDSEEFLDGFRESSRGNYVLAEAGESLDSVRPADIGSFTDFLFDELVEQPKPAVVESDKQQEDRELRRAFSAVIDAAGLKGSRNYFADIAWPCRIRGTVQPFHFDGATMSANGQLQTVMQRVSLLKNDSVASTAFKFQGVRESDSVEQEHCFAAYYADEQLEEDDRRTEAVRLLKTLGNPVNFFHRDSAVAELRRVG